MKGRFWRKALAAALALLIVSGSTPIQPFSQVFDRTVIKASAATQTVTKTVKFDMDGGQSGTTAKLDDYNIYSNSAGTLHWSCNQPNVNYISYSYNPENGRPGTTRLRGNLLQYEGTAEFCDIVGKVTKVEISNFNIRKSGVEMCVGQDKTNTSTLLHLEGTTNDYDYSSTDGVDYGSVVFEGEVDVDKNNPLKIMLYPPQFSDVAAPEFKFRGGSITITYEVEEEVTGDPGHTFSFSTTGNTLTATCNQTDADHACGLTNGTATLTLTANDMAFDGSLLRRFATLNTQEFSNATGITDIVTTFIYEDKNTHETSPTGVIFPGDYTVTATIIINGDTAHPYTLTKDFSVVDGHKINNVYSQFSLSKSAALKDEEVTITYSQKMDESLEGLTLTGATSGNNIAYTQNGNTYTFTMPGEDVNINATITYPLDENNITQNGDTFTIKTADGWDYFCQRMMVDGELNGFSGKTVELSDNITVTTMAGSTNYPFKGTFDGKGHTLTFNTTALVANTAPFQLTDGATIRNLHATGSIEGGTWHYISGLVGSASGKLTIENCRVSTQISSTVSGIANNGGFVGLLSSQYNQCHITGCVFDGLIYNPNYSGTTYGCGGFVGCFSQYGYAMLEDCLFIEGQYDNNNGKCELWWGNENDKNSTFLQRSNGYGSGELTNCFYVGTHGLKQGSPAVASATEPANLGAGPDHCFMKSYGHVLFFDGKYYTPKYGDLIEQYGCSGEKSYTIECNDGTSLGIPDFTSQLSTTYLRYNRKFTAGKAEVVMLPFNFTKNDFRRGGYDNQLDGKFYSFAGMDGLVPVMDDTNEVTSMTANTPYIYVPGENSEYWYIVRYESDITIFTEGNDGGNKTVTDEYGLWTLTGTYEPKSFTTDDYNIMVLNDVGELVAVTDALNDPVGELVVETDATKVRSTSGYFVRDSSVSVFAISVLSGAGGTITANSRYAKENDTVTLTVTPDAGYVLKLLTVKDSSNNPITVTNNQFTMPDSNVTVTAVFEAIGYTISKTADHGTISAKVGDAIVTTANYGESVTLDVIPDTGYTVKSVKVGNTEIEPVNGVYSFTMPADNVTVTAEFEAIDYNISITAPANGSVSATVGETANATTAHYGDTVILTATPTGEYVLKSLTVKDSSNNPITVTNNQFTMPATNVTVTAEFIKYTLVSANEPTYTSAGNIEYYTGSDGKYYVLENGEYIETTLEAVTLAQLTLTHVTAADPTCTANGNIEYWYDATNEKYFSDANGEHEITQADTVRAATNHDWNAPTYSWTAVDGGYKCTATRNCKNNASHEETEEATVTYAEITAPTAGAKGSGRYTATFINSAFAVQTKDVEIEMLTPEYADATYKWAADNSSVTAEKKCLNGGVDITETVNTTSQITKPATCKAMGETTYYAVFTNGAFAKQEKTVANIEKLAHTPAEAVVENRVEPTYDADGSYDSVVYCSVCGEEISREKVIIPKLERANISSANVTFNLMHLTYTGSAITPVFQVKLGDKVLTENTDFTVQGGNVGTATGTYTLTLSGTGEYTGTVTAEWYIDPVKTYHVNVTNGTIKGGFDYEEQAVVTVVGNTEVGGWYNGDTLVSAERTYSFYAVSDVDLEWKANDTYAAEKAQEGIANITISPRTVNTNGKTTVTVTSTWTLPEGAEIVKAGTYRCYVDKGADTPDSNYMITNGTFNASTLTECKGTFYFNINMGVVSAARKLCTMTYVTYTLNGETYTITSDVAYSEAE